MDKIMDSFGIFDYAETQSGTYEYSAAEMREQFAGLVGNGVLKGIGNQFNASTAGLQVTIDTGEGWLLGVHGKMKTTSAFTLDPVVSGMSKICSVVLDVDIPNQLMGLSVLAGMQAASPSAPQITQSETRYQQVIWQARVHDDGTITLSDFRTYLIRPGDGTTPESIGAASLTGGKVTASEASSSIVQHTASHNVALSDIGKLLQEDSTSAIVVTIPAQATLAAPAESELEIVRWNTGAVSIAPASGVTIVSLYNARTISGQYGVATLKCISTNVWLLAGALA